MKDHEDLVEAAEEAITEVFSDVSVPRSTTRDSLTQIKETIDACLDSMDEDDRAVSDDEGDD